MCWLSRGYRFLNPWINQVKLPDYASYKVARELYRQHSKTDSLLIQGRWRSVAYIQELKDDTQKPLLVRVEPLRILEHCCLALVGHARPWNQSPDPALQQTFARLCSALH